MSEALSEGLDKLEKLRQESFRSMVETARLRSFGLFAGLEEEELAEIARHCDQIHVPSGTIIILQGQVGKDVYLLEAGSVGVYHGEPDPSHFIAVLQAPTLIGERALVDPERIRTASVKALTDLVLLPVPIDSFLSFVRRYPPLREKLRQLIAERR